VVQEEALEEEVLDLEHVHLRLAADHLRRRAVFVLRDPVLGVAAEEDADLGQRKSQLPRVLLPEDELIDQLEVGLLVLEGVVALGLVVAVPLEDDLAVLAETHLLADGAAAAFEVEFVVLGAMHDLGNRHIILLHCLITIRCLGCNGVRDVRDEDM
jgi:hypothetical protein